MNKINNLNSLNIAISQRLSSGSLNIFQQWVIQEFGNKSKWKDQFCEEMCITLPTLNSWCKGERPKKVDDIIKLAEVTGLSYQVLINGRGNEC